MTERKVRWGVLSTAGIGVTKVIPAILKSRRSEVVAIASRDLPRAEAAIARLGLGGRTRAVGSYEALLADPGIDAIYNPLPNHLHVPLTLAATAAGKHVLCEKPIAMNAAEAEQLRAVPADRVVSEAFMIRFHPQWHRVREIVRSGELGELRAIRAVFSYRNLDPANVRNRAEVGGGALMDIGCYPIAVGRFVLGEEPRRVVSLIDRDPAFTTDRLTSVLADFGAGRQLSFVVGTQNVPQQKVEILGTQGRLEVIIPFNAPPDERTAIVIDTGAPFDGSLARREIVPACDQYTEQAEAFCRAVLGEAPLEWGIEDAIRQMRVIDAVRESERTGGWASVAAA
jgi:predicted dehydrogenase